MTTQQILGIQEGIWIDKALLQQAGLGEHLKLIVEQGEIRIITAPEAEKGSDSYETNWTEETTEIFLSLGHNASPGKLKNSSVNHDHYLYGKTE